MGNIIDGRKVANNMQLEIKEKIQVLVAEQHKIPTVASIVVGNDGGSLFYVNNQENIAKKIGVNFHKYHFENEVTEESLLELISELNIRDDISGIIVQLPLPETLNEKNIISKILPEKDIDCLTYTNQGKLYMGEKTHLPCTPNSVITLLKSLNIDLEGKDVVVIGRSNIVGKPLLNLLLNENMTVTICHSKTKNLKEICSKAEIIISAIGKPMFITEEYVKDGAIVIDVGTTSVNGKIKGDVDFDNVINKASYITPVPGGVGALTTTLLIKNACEDLFKYED